MILPLFLASASLSAADGLPLSREQHIARLDQKMRQWRGDVRENGKDGLRCITRRSSGDEQIDAIACDTQIQCTAGAGHYIRQAQSMSSESTRQELLAKVRFDVEQCTRNARRKAIERLAESYDNL